jgi:hypothetical protein
MPYAHHIDLDWLDGSEYHRFLLWVIKNTSGVDGYNGLQEGQVRFGRRDLERLLGIGSTKATFLIKKAVCDGLLNPLGKSSNHRGMGEIYSIEGDLKSTRFHAKPTTNQQQTNNKPTKQLEVDNLTPFVNQQQTNSKPTANRLIDKSKEIKETKEKKSTSIRLEDVVEIWNTTTQGMLPSAKTTPKRIKSLSLVADQSGWLDDFRAACEFCAATPFYRGENDRQWAATIDYLLRDGKASELAEKGRFTPKPIIPKYARATDYDDDFSKQLAELRFN